MRVSLRASLLFGFFAGVWIPSDFRWTPAPFGRNSFSFSYPSATTWTTISSCGLVLKSCLRTTRRKLTKYMYTPSQHIIMFRLQSGPEGPMSNNAKYDYRFPFRSRPLMFSIPDELCFRGQTALLDNNRSLVLLLILANHLETITSQTALCS